MSDQERVDAPAALPAEPASAPEPARTSEGAPAAPVADAPVPQGDGEAPSAAPARSRRRRADRQRTDEPAAEGSAQLAKGRVDSERPSGDKAAPGGPADGKPADGRQAPAEAKADGDKSGDGATAPAPAASGDGRPAGRPADDKPASDGFVRAEAKADAGDRASEPSDGGAPVAKSAQGQEESPARTPRKRTRRQRDGEAPASDATEKPKAPKVPKPAAPELDAGGQEATAAPEAPAPSDGADAPRQYARPARGKGLGKPVEEMSIEELVAQFSRRRRGRPSKRELQMREALMAAKANPTAELVDRARAAVIASLGPAQRAATPEAEAPEGQVRAGETAADERPAKPEQPAGPEQAAEPEQQSVEALAQPARQQPEAPVEGGYGTRRRRHERRPDDRQERPGPGEGSWQKDRRHDRDQQRRDQQRRDNRSQQDRGGFQNQGVRRDANRPGAGQDRQYGKNGRRNSRDRRECVVEPRTNREELEELKVGDLRAKAVELGIDPAGLKKPELIDAVYAALVRQEGFFKFKGILDLTPEGFGFIRTRGYLASEHDVYISAALVRSCALRRGDEVAGIAHTGRPSDKYPAANKVLAVNGKDPEALRGRPRFGDLTPVFPSEPLKMEHGKDSILGRCIDLVAPIGKGQRGLIVSPPKAGKTTVLKKIAESIAANNPEVHLICLLVDERPEEVTDMERSINGEVVASTFDMPCDNHITVSELVVERAKRLVEQGEDVVILLDSITRLARAYNLAQPASGRILSGGVDSTALYPPKRFLGAARNIEDGGSLTILASALVDTGSKMDEVIFEEFKGTGNMELKLDRDLADRRIFPAIDPVASGTRKEELLLDPGIAPFVWGIRRILAGMNSNERAMSSLIKSLKATANNEEFLVRSAKKAQTQELNGDF